jgi:rRNA maturation endonuclease Nob1
MFSRMALSTFFPAFTTLATLVIGVMWFLYDRRDRRICDRQRFRHAYRCIKCGRIYERRGQREVATCPDCGFANDRLRF